MLSSCCVIPSVLESSFKFALLVCLFNVDCRNWELIAPWDRAEIKVPVKFIVGDVDLTYNVPGVKDYINKGGLKKVVPLLEEVVVMEGVGHFINQERPEEINNHIYNFFNKFI